MCVTFTVGITFSVVITFSGDTTVNFCIQNINALLQLLGDVPEQEDEEDAELQASIADANKWRKMVALTKQRALQVLTNTVN